MTKGDNAGLIDVRQGRDHAGDALQRRRGFAGLRQRLWGKGMDQPLKGVQCRSRLIVPGGRRARL